MTATDELRKMLDERGVEWQSGTRYYVTHWSDCERHFTAVEQDSKLYVQYSVGPLTPTQVIAATLGEKTCRITVQDNMTETEGMGDVWLECDTCGFQMPLEPSTPRFNFCPNCGRRIEVDK